MILKMWLLALKSTPSLTITAFTSSAEMHSNQGMFALLYRNHVHKWSVCCWRASMRKPITAMSDWKNVKQLQQPNKYIQNKSRQSVGKHAYIHGQMKHEQEITNLNGFRESQLKSQPKTANCLVAKDILGSYEACKPRLCWYEMYKTSKSEILH